MEPTSGMNQPMACRDGYVVGQRTSVGFPVGVLTPLQYELLALEIMVLKTHPAADMSGESD
ncbi:hypothetical protein GOODEAATRI_029769, partial [Goodea atripinnis]